MAKPQKHQISDATTLGGHSPWSTDKNTDSVLILEKALEQGGQEWVENLNIIEQHLLDIVDTVGQRQPLLKANYILRRLPLHCVSFVKSNNLYKGVKVR